MLKPKLLIAALLVALATIGSACIIVTSSFQVGSIRYFGAEIHNHTNANILSHNVELAFLDANNNLLGVLTQKGCLRSVQGGARQFVDVPTTATNANKIIAKIKLDDEFKVGPAATGNVEITDVTAVRTGEDLVITGKVENKHATTLTNTRVCGVVRNASGNVIRVGNDSAGSLAQDASANFSITVKVPNDSTAAKVDIWVDGFQNNVVIKPISKVGTDVTLPTTPTATNTPDATATPEATPTNTPEPTETPING
jgi:hypothetical protein